MPIQQNQAVVIAYINLRLRHNQEKSPVTSHSDVFAKCSFREKRFENIAKYNVLAYSIEVCRND